MSGRGPPGRGGGGGGRGGGASWGGRGGLSQSKEFLKRSAQEAGLDDRHMKLLSDITRPAFYPDVLWRASGDGYWNENDESTTKNGKSNELIILKRLPTVINTMNKQRELMNRFQKSSHYVRPDVAVDIERYSTLNDASLTLPAADVAVLQSLGRNGKLATDDRYFPTELIYPNINNNRKKKQNLLDKANRMKKTLSSNLDDDEVVGDDADNADTKRGGDSDNDDDDDELEQFEQIEDDEEEEGEDYTTNYYESDNDDAASGGAGGGDDDNEPTFD